jgi:hypothetical protein
MKLWEHYVFSNTHFHMISWFFRVIFNCWLTVINNKTYYYYIAKIVKLFDSYYYYKIQEYSIFQRSH